MSLPRPGKAPCGTCPYRKDAPSGIWDRSEYEKLPRYDRSTVDQFIEGTLGLFYCHQQDGRLCAGWVGCHDLDELAAIRINPVAPECFDYRSPVPLFESGAEAAAHGLRDIDDPRPEARRSIGKLAARIGS